MQIWSPRQRLNRVANYSTNTDLHTRKDVIRFKREEYRNQRNKSVVFQCDLRDTREGETTKNCPRAKTGHLQRPAERLVGHKCAQVETS